MSMLTDKKQGISPLYKLTVSAVFLSLGLVLRSFTTVYIPILGAAGLKVGFYGIFSIFPALIFGPWYGGAVMALSDLIGALIMPQGAYIPLLTVTQFAAGVMIGFLARLFLPAREKFNKTGIIRAVAITLLAVVFALGVACQISLISDHIIDSPFSIEGSLGKKGDIERAEKNPLSAAIVSLASYTTDSFTLENAQAKTGQEIYAVPATITDTDGVECKVVSIGNEAFKNSSDLKTVLIPAQITSISSTAFDGVKDRITIVAIKDSYAATFASDAGIKVNAVTSETYASMASEADSTAICSSNNKYRQTLAGYITFVTLGFEIISLVTIALIVIGQFIGKKNERFVRILSSIFFPNFIVTTVNTVILKYALTAWNNRSFMILWIPRAAEEILSCIILSYAISIIYGVYVEKIAPRFEKRFSGSKPVKENS